MWEPQLQLMTAGRQLRGRGEGKMEDGRETFLHRAVCLLASAGLWYHTDSKHASRSRAGLLTRCHFPNHAWLWCCDEAHIFTQKTTGRLF